MGHKKKSKSFGIMKFILNIALLLPTLYNLVGKVFLLAAYEAHLARKNLIKITIIAILTGIVLASTWLCLLAAYGLYLISLGLSYSKTLLVLVFINILILIIMGLLIKDAEKNLFFRATRSQIRKAFKNEQ